MSTLHKCSDKSLTSGPTFRVCSGNTDRGEWEKVGNVVGGPEDSDTVGVPSKWHEGRQYDYVVDVDFEDDVPPKKLAFNRNDNPYDVAERSVFFVHTPCTSIP